jgi:hypothetical protein
MNARISATALYGAVFRRAVHINISRLEQQVHFHTPGPLKLKTDAARVRPFARLAPVGLPHDELSVF